MNDFERSNFAKRMLDAHDHTRLIRPITPETLTNLCAQMLAFEKYLEELENGLSDEPLTEEQYQKALDNPEMWTPITMSQYASPPLREIYKIEDETDE